MREGSNLVGAFEKLVLYLTVATSLSYWRQK